MKDIRLCGCKDSLHHETRINLLLQPRGTHLRGHGESPLWAKFHYLCPEAQGANDGLRQEWPLIGDHFMLDSQACATE